MRIGARPETALGGFTRYTTCDATQYTAMLLLDPYPHTQIQMHGANGVYGDDDTRPCKACSQDQIVRRRP